MSVFSYTPHVETLAEVTCGMDCFRASLRRGSRARQKRIKGTPPSWTTSMFQHASAMPIPIRNDIRDVQASEVEAQLDVGSHSEAHHFLPEREHHSSIMSLDSDSSDSSFYVDDMELYDIVEEKDFMDSNTDEDGGCRSECRPNGERNSLNAKEVSEKESTNSGIIHSEEGSTYDETVGIHRDASLPVCIPLAGPEKESIGAHGISGFRTVDFEASLDRRYRFGPLSISPEELCELEWARGKLLQKRARTLGRGSEGEPATGAAGSVKRTVPLHKSPTKRKRHTLFWAWKKVLNLRSHISFSRDMHMIHVYQGPTQLETSKRMDAALVLASDIWKRHSITPTIVLGKGSFQMVHPLKVTCPVKLHGAGANSTLICSNRVGIRSASPFLEVANLSIRVRIPSDEHFIVMDSCAEEMYTDNTGLVSSQRLVLSNLKAENRESGGALVKLATANDTSLRIQDSSIQRFGYVVDTACAGDMFHGTSTSSIEVVSSAFEAVGSVVHVADIIERVVMRDVSCKNGALLHVSEMRCRGEGLPVQVVCSDCTVSLAEDEGCEVSCRPRYRPIIHVEDVIEDNEDGGFQFTGHGDSSPDGPCLHTPALDLHLDNLRCFSVCSSPTTAVQIATSRTGKIPTMITMSNSEFEGTADGPMLVSIDSGKPATRATQCITNISACTFSHYKLVFRDGHGFGVPVRILECSLCDGVLELSPLKASKHAPQTRAHCICEESTLHNTVIDAPYANFVCYPSSELQGAEEECSRSAPDVEVFATNRYVSTADVHDVDVKIHNNHSVHKSSTEKDSESELNYRENEGTVEHAADLTEEACHGTQLGGDVQSTLQDSIQAAMVTIGYHPTEDC